MNDSRLARAMKVYELTSPDRNGLRHVMIHPIIYTNAEYTYLKTHGDLKLQMVPNNSIYGNVEQFLSEAEQGEWGKWALLHTLFFVENPEPYINDIKLLILKREMESEQRRMEKYKEMLRDAERFLDGAKRAYETALAESEMIRQESDSE